MLTMGQDSWLSMALTALLLLVAFKSEFPVSDHKLIRWLALYLFCSDI